MMSQSSMLTAQSGPISMSLVARSAHATAADISKPAAQAHDHHRPRPKTLNPNLKGDSAPEPPLLRSGAMGPTRSCQDERGGAGEFVRGIGGGGSGFRADWCGIGCVLGRKGWSESDWFGIGVGEVGEKGKRGRTCGLFPA